MRRIATWGIVVGVLIGLVVPRVAYACTTPPDTWYVEITGIIPDDSMLPDGLVLAKAGTSVALRNDTEIKASLLKDESTLMLIPPNKEVRLSPSRHYLLIPDASYDMAFTYVEPILPTEITLTVEHGDQRYSVPAVVTYSIEFDPMDEIDCGYGWLWLYDLPIAVPILIGVAVVIVIGMAWATRKVINDGREAR